MKLHYLDFPSEGPALLLLHGLTANAHAFDGLINAGLSEHWRVLAPDLRGRGLSPKPATGYNMKDHAGDVLELMDNLSLSSAVVGGHSFGGLLSIYLAYHFPERVQKLVILDAAARLHPQTREMLVPSLSRLGQTYASFESYLDKVKASPYLTFWDESMLSYYKADVEELPDGLVRPRPSVENMTEAVVKGSFGEPWADYLCVIRQPALLVNGTGNYNLGAPLLPKEFALESVAMMPSCQYYEVAGNHQTMLYGEGAVQTVAALRSFGNPA